MGRLDEYISGVDGSLLDPLHALNIDIENANEPRLGDVSNGHLAATIVNARFH